jgi:hypothetical protein
MVTEHHFSYIETTSLLICLQLTHNIYYFLKINLPGDFSLGILVKFFDCVAVGVMVVIEVLPPLVNKESKAEAGLPLLLLGVEIALIPLATTLLAAEDATAGLLFITVDDLPPAVKDGGGTLLTALIAPPPLPVSLLAP